MTKDYQNPLETQTTLDVLQDKIQNLHPKPRGYGVDGVVSLAMPD